MSYCPTGRHANSGHGRCTCGRSKGSGGAQFRSSDARYRRAGGSSRRPAPGGFSASQRNAASGCTTMIGLLSLAAVLLGRLAGRHRRGR
jgi:hypothetical protein